jgi:FMN phosphatase YigB (HAD superfamily)
MIKAILFDLFNTLVEHQCPEELLIDRLNLEFDFLYLQKLVCGQVYRDWDNYVETILAGVQKPLTDENKAIVNRVFEEDAARITFFNDSLPVLRYLKAKGYKLGLVSNIGNPKLDRIRGTEMQRYFNSIIYSYEVGAVKPDPKLFLACIKELCVEPEEALMVGDNLNADIRAAETLGIKGVLVDRENRHPEIKQRVLALSELAKFLD